MGPSIGTLRTVSLPRDNVITMGFFDPEGAPLLVVFHLYNSNRNNSNFSSLMFGTTPMTNLRADNVSDAHLRISYLNNPGSASHDIVATLTGDESQTLWAFVVNDCSDVDPIRSSNSGDDAATVQITSELLDLVISAVCSEGDGTMSIVGDEVLMGTVVGIGDDPYDHSGIIAQQPGDATQTPSQFNVLAFEDGVNSGLSIKHLTAPTFVSIDPAAGTELGGDAVEIDGTGFQSGATVTFGGVAATSVVFINNFVITCVTPAHAVGAVNIVVTNPDSQTATGTGVFTYQATSWTAGVFSNWTDVLSGTGAISAEGTIKHGGSYSMKLDAGDALVQSYQTIDAFLGGTYKATCWVKGDYDILFGSETTFNEQSGTAADWTELTFEIVAENTTVMLVAIADSTHVFYLDDVSITAIERHAMFTGRISAIRPTAGDFENPNVEVDAQDWGGYLSTQELGIQTIDYDQTFDVAIQAVLPNFPVQPEDVIADTGIQSFAIIFNADSPDSSMAQFFQKMARNEFGRIYVNGAGELILENRYNRAEQVQPAFILNDSMTDLDVSWERNNIYNIVHSTVYPSKIDAAATTLLWTLNGAPKINHGESLIIRCAYTDPNTGGNISAIDIVNNAPTDPYIEFGRKGDFTSNDLISFLTVSLDIGANATDVTLTNTHPTVDGYLNDLQIHGKGIYIYDQIKSKVIDQDSIDLGTGERKFSINLEHITDPNDGHNYAAWILGSVSRSHVAVAKIKFNAITDELEDIALNAEISQRFTLVESATGIGEDFYINNLEYSFEDGYLVCTILATPDLARNAFIWDSSHWDDEDDARWVL